MRGSALFRRFFVTATINSLAVALLVTWIALVSTDRIELEREQRNFRGIAESVLTRFTDADYDLTLLSDEFQQLRRLHPGLELYIVDQRGVLQFFLGAGTASYGSRINLETVEHYLREREASLPLYIESPSIRGQKEVFSVAQFEYRGEKLYLMLVPGAGMRTLTIRNLRENYGLLATLLIVPVIALLATIVAAFTLRFLAARFATLLQGVERFAAGDLSSRIPNPTKDEIGTIAEAFNQMADSLSRSMEELSKRDAVRRELIADISHDLRRPLQLLRLSIDGILAATARGERLAEYLLTPLASNLGGLQRLLDELFELAKLEGRETPLEFLSLDLGEFLSELTDRFQPLARSREIALRCEGADIVANAPVQPELLERALSNLIENALRHTNSGGSVVTTLTRDDEFATLTVRDTGHGIAPEARERLFERFAQGENQPTTHSGCGLGLAIVRKIVEVHQSAITVESTVGEGTAFSFRLALRRAGQVTLSAAAILIASSSARADAPLTIAVVRAADPTELVTSELRCSTTEHEQLVGAADLDGDGRDELIIRSTEGMLFRRQFETIGCNDQTLPTKEIPLDHFIGAIDSNRDRRDELYFLDRRRKGVHQLDSEGIKFISTAAFPDSGEFHVMRPLPEREAALVALDSKALYWLPFTSKHPNIHRLANELGSTVVRVPPADSLLLRLADSHQALSLLQLHTGFVTIPDSNWTLVPFESPVEVKAGDFDGDGVDDLLMELPGILGYWIRTTNEFGQLEFPLRGGKGISLRGCAVGDFDGNGVDEVVQAAPGGGLVTLALPPLTPFPGVQVEVGDKRAGVTDERGLLQLQPFTRPNTVRVQAADALLERPIEDLESTVRFVLRDRSLARTDGSAVGNTATESGPRVCLGYYQQHAPRSRSWSGVVDRCPPHYAMFGFDDGDTAEAPRRFDCCPLPANDILLPEESLAAKECPDTQLAVGLQLSPDRRRVVGVRCAPINTKRYTLSQPLPGKYWGVGYSSRSFQRATPWHELPVAMRFGIGRLTIGSWDTDGCIGSPPGALAVGPFTGKCEAGQFRQLRYQPSAGGQPVPMFPDCVSIANLTDPRSGCAKRR